MNDVLVQYIITGLLFLGFMMVGAVVARRYRFYSNLLVEEAGTRAIGLDGLRGYLALSVFIHHAAMRRTWILTGEWITPTELFGALGQTSVVLFFMITGFLFWCRAIAKPRSFATLAFARSRIFRIAPLYLAASSIPLCMAIWYYVTLHAPLKESVVGVFSILSLGMRTWPTVGSFESGSVIAGVYWTLRYEWEFYIALPILALTIVPRYRFILVCLVLVGWELFRRRVHFVHHEFTFAFGMAVAYFFANPRIRKWSESKVVTAVMLALFLAMPVVNGEPHSLLGLFVSFLLFAIVTSGSSLFGLLRFASSRTLGTISYSIYLVHGIVLYMAQPAMRWALRQPHGDCWFWLLILLAGVILILASSLTFRFIEYPFIEYEKRLRKSGAKTETAVKATAAIESTSGTVG